MKTRPDRRANIVAGTLTLIGLIVVGLVVLLTGGHGTGAHRGPQTNTSAKSPAPASSTAAPAPASAGLPFAPDSVWNQAQPADAQVSPDSARYVAHLVNLTHTPGAFINTSQYSVPVYVVGAKQARVPVRLDVSGPGATDQLARAFAAGVPIPPNAQAAQGTDAHMVVWQPSSNTLWEFWEAHQVNGLWHASWGGVMPNVSASPGYYTAPNTWGASATSLSILGGLISPAELASGSIDHALAMGIPQAAAGVYAFPAQRTDGASHATDAIPEGTRFRLPASLNLAALHLPAVTLATARAAQRYGIIVRDQSGSVSLYADAPLPGAADPYVGRTGLFAGQSPAQLLASFPWQDLQVVRAPLFHTH